jgi:hypothetical protein
MVMKRLVIGPSRHPGRFMQQVAVPSGRGENVPMLMVLAPQAQAGRSGRS